MVVEKLTTEISRLGECPLWNEQEQKLYWTDITGKIIWTYSSVTAKEEIYGRFDFRVGGFAFTKKNELILCSDCGVYICKKNGLNPQLLCNIDFEKNERFNDVTVDPAGRILAGTLKIGYERGNLYSLEIDKSPRIVLRNLGISNGMCFDENCNRFYHTDSYYRTISCYNYNQDNGTITNRKVIYRGLDSDGYPDGITMDTNGDIWVACWGASQVLRIDKSDGTILQRVIIPARQPSSITFGGEDLSILYITSAAEGAINFNTGKDKEGNFLGGYLYCCSPGVKGKKEYYANFKTE